MGVSRRHFVASLGLFAAGCAQGQVSQRRRPSPLWPDPVAHPEPTGTTRFIRPSTEGLPRTPWPRQAAPRLANLPLISRHQWAKADPIPKRLNVMGGKSRITVHHEGWTPVWFDDDKQTAARLDSIRRSHLKRMRAGDIGYHFVIDRGGRIWQGRDLRYQGAHVKNHNEHNIGVMVLGNFDLQRPATVQISTLQKLLSALRASYDVPVRRIHTHRELNPTTCPGKHLQSGVASLRSNGHLA
ncbi:MAG: peptidoglycan recognition family protein [Phycisphaeraceae bacterium]|nr:peptidoglycan recognition family protein [Phycisphaeraceae bacterium]